MILSLLACSVFEPTWIDQTPACAAAPYDWSDDLVSYVKSGPGDGSFNLNPLGYDRESLVGAYDTANGEFAYSVAYGEGYWMESDEEKDGLGTAWHNGNLDVEYVQTTQDRLGTKESKAWRVQREGCHQEWWTWDPEAEDPVYQAFEGVFSADGFAWEANLEDGTWTGSLAPDSSRTVDQTTDTDENHWVYAADGTSTLAFDVSQSGYTFIGDEEVAWNGDFVRSYKIKKDGETYCNVDEEFDYDGDGFASYECDDGDYECEYDVKDSGSCVFECDNGDKGAC